MHWATDYIGKPWVSGARGPDAFDCWGLLWWVYRHQFQIELPIYAGVNPKDVKRVGRLMTDGSVDGDWLEIETPEEGCAVAMSQNKVIHHVGIFLNADGGVVLHAGDKLNVLAQPIKQLSQYGWRTVRYYKHKDKQ